MNSNKCATGLIDVEGESNNMFTESSGSAHDCPARLSVKSSYPEHQADMKHFDTWRLTKMLYLIECARRDGIRFEIDGGRSDENVTKEFRTKWVDEILRDARELVTKADLCSVESRVCDTGALTLALKHGLSYRDLDYELKFLRECFQTDLSKPFIYAIDSKKQDYLTTKKLLDVWGSSGFYFPSIRRDAGYAMRAYAFELNTSCVFHLMRVTEIGLRALARRMQVKLHNRQLEWGQWQEILREMSIKADKLAASKRAGRAKDELLEFYRGSIGEFQGFKDAYRNFVMHMREKSNYDEDEAHSLIMRVSHFMSRLAGKVDEQGHLLTPARIKQIEKQYDAEAAAESEKQKNEQIKRGTLEIRPNNARAVEGSTQRDTEQSREIEKSKGAEA